MEQFKSQNHISVKKRWEIIFFLFFIKIILIKEMTTINNNLLYFKKLYQKLI